MRWIPLALLAAIAASPARAAEPDSLPGWMKPGARVTYFQGSASIASDGQILVLDDQGNWVNVAGEKFSEKDTVSTGSGGFFQLTILAADVRVVAAETHVFLLTDPQGGRVTSSVAGSLIGTSAALADYWISPGALAARPDAKEGGVTVRRMPYPLRGRKYDALVTEVRSGTSYTRTTYDLATGLLLAASTASVAAGGYVPNPNGTSAMKAGSNLITTTMLADVRQLKVPWIDDARPEAIARGTRLDFRGTYATEVAGSPGVSQALSTNLVFGDPGARWAPVRLSASLTPLLGGPPQESVADLAFGSASTMPGWIQPKTIARLEPGTVVDEDPITRFRTTYLGVRGDFAAIVEEGPFDRGESAFDVRTGLLVASSTLQQNGLGRTQIRIERVQAR